MKYKVNGGWVRDGAIKRKGCVRSENLTVEVGK
jgi:hypothetical protein